MCVNVTAEYARLEGFDMTTDVCLRCQEVALVHVAVLFLVSIWHNDMSAESLHLKMVLTRQ